MKPEEIVDYKPPTVEEQVLAFLNSRPFIRTKLIDGKLGCGNCGRLFPANLPTYIQIDDSNEQLLCYPCNYNRLGTTAEEVHKSKRQQGEQLQTMREQRMEHSKAYQIAKNIITELAPYCPEGFCNIAGSLRRKKPDVKDIEIVALPKTIEQQYGLFDTILVRHPDFITKVNGLGKIIKGSPEEGRYVQIELSDGLKLDLFIPQEYDYWRQFVIRTGSADYVKSHIAAAWSKLGWCGTEDGLREIHSCEAKYDKQGKLTKWVYTAKFYPIRPPVWKSEKDFFEWLSVPYVEPENRK